MRRIPRPSPATVIALIALGSRSAEPPTRPARAIRSSAVARNPGIDQSKALTKETEIIANTSGYGTRQSNKSASGGGAIYGCRSGAGGTPASNEPCVRANNLTAGLAFELVTDGRRPGASRPRTHRQAVHDQRDRRRHGAQRRPRRQPRCRPDRHQRTRRPGPAEDVRVLLVDRDQRRRGDRASGRDRGALLQTGPFTIYGKCFVDTDAAPACRPSGRRDLRAHDADGALLDGQVDTLDGQVAFLNAATAEADRQVDAVQANPATGEPRPRRRHVGARGARRLGLRVPRCARRQERRTLARQRPLGRRQPLRLRLQPLRRALIS